MKKNYFAIPFFALLLPILINLYNYNKIPNSLPAIIIPFSGEVSVWTTKSVLYVLKSSTLTIIIFLLAYLFFKSINKLLLVKCNEKLYKTKGIYYYYSFLLLVLLKELSYSVIFFNAEVENRSLSDIGYLAYLCVNFATIFQFAILLKTILYFKQNYKLNILASKSKNSILLFSYSKIFNLHCRRAYYFMVFALLYIAIVFIV